MIKVERVIDVGPYMGATLGSELHTYNDRKSVMYAKQDDGTFLAVTGLTTYKHHTATQKFNNKQTFVLGEMK